MTGLLATADAAVSLFGDRSVGLVILGIAAVAAGIINAIAGGGSFLILPILTALGLPPGVANGTLRVGVLPQCAAIVATFWRQGVTVPPVTWMLAIPMCVGALGGSTAAAHLDDALLEPIFGVVFLAWALWLALRPSKFLSPGPEPRKPGIGAVLASLAIGVYGGFMQAGVGFPLLALWIGHLHYDAVRANAIKAASSFAFTLVSLLVFASAGKIVWLEAMVLTAGSVVGGWMGARLQVKAGPGIVRWGVMIMVAVSGIFMLIRSLSG